jgi:DNA-binding transcriptional LysR family regulator
MDRIDSVSVFVEVAEQGSFAEAARRLERSPAAVTRAIAQLEARLGVRLLNRTTRAVSLTEVGQRFLAGAKRVIADLDEIEQAAAGQGSAPRGELMLTAPIVFGRLHVLPIVTEFLNHYAAVTVRLNLMDRPVDLIGEGLDAAIRIGVLADSTAIANRVGAVKRVVVASPAYLARRGVPGKPNELTNHDVVVFTTLSGSDRWIFRRGSDDAAVRVSPRLAVTTAEAALDVAKAGFGITRVISYQAADALADGSLVRLFPDYDAEDLPVHILYPGGRHPAPKLRAFIDFAAPRLRRRLEQVAQTIGR